MTPLERLLELHATTDPTIEDLLLSVTQVLRPNPPPLEVSVATLDHLALQIDDHTPDGIAAHLFGPAGFSGDVEDYHAPENSFLDAVLMRRTGMPITLAAVLIAVARRCDVGLHGVGMPGHFLVGVDGDPDHFLDPFAGGVSLNLATAEQRFRQLFGPAAPFEPEMLRPVTPQSMLSRVLNNLTRTLAERDARMLDPLIDLRAALPGPASERRLVIGMAEARGRWDVAARLREELDPDDPTADGLWARLN